MQTLSYSEQEARRVDHDRFLCALFAPAVRREELCSLLVFNQEVAKIPELVVDPTLRQIRLQWWQDQVAACRTGGTGTHPVLAPLARGMERAGLDATVMTPYFDARLADLEVGQPADMAALEAYGRATSGLLTEVAARLLGAASEPALQAARDVGLAWALVGLARSVPHHARSGRCYIPASLCREHGIETDKLLAARRPEGLTAAIAILIARARELVRSARSARSRIAPAVVPALLPAVLAEAYAGILERNAFDPFSTAVDRPRFAALVHLAVKARLGRY